MKLEIPGCDEGPKYQISRNLGMPVLDKRNYKDEVKLRLNRQGIALRE